jgi:hypothetical protein
MEPKKGGYYFKLLVQALLELSEEKHSFAKAILEWDAVGFPQRWPRNKMCLYAPDR